MKKQDFVVYIKKSTLQYDIFQKKSAFLVDRGLEVWYGSLSSPLVAHLFHVQVRIDKWWGEDRVAKERHVFEKECMISHDKNSRVQVWSKGPETWHGEVIVCLDVSIALVHNKSQIGEGLCWLERKGTWGNCYNLWVQGVHRWREEVIRNRKGEWRVDFQKLLDITVCLYC